MAIDEFVTMQNIYQATPFKTGKPIFQRHFIGNICHKQKHRRVVLMI
jgi:hypothetical protein